MRVKRLEIQGFKSFKDKTVIHFDHEITGIVGPNGCGKSNIVDAFFWVMGEQSYKHMRGTGSEDLIFNGSSKYSPLGFAEATLVLETETIDPSAAPMGASAADIPLPKKTQEISVTRKVYRSGEGEYFINHQPARLKDIHELFMDTGVGAKGYSIIEQGQIGKIVNSKPEERRTLIEEAAGIAKYKSRKRESLRKMEQASANLARLQDVINELERSLGSLERQAQKANRYKRLKSELTEKEMTWGRRRFKVLRSKIEHLGQERAILEAEITSFRSRLTTVETEVETDRVAQLTLQKNVEELQTQIQRSSDELTRAQSALELSKQRQGDLAHQLDVLEGEKIELQEILAEEAQTLETLKAEKESHSSTFQAALEGEKTAQEKTQHSREAYQRARLETETLSKELFQAMEQLAQTEAQFSSIASRMETFRSQIERVTESLQDLESRRHAETNSLQEAEASLSTFQIEFKTSQESLIVTQQQLQIARASKKESEVRLEELSREKTKIESRLSSLREVDEAREGLDEGAKSLLQWAKSQGHEHALTALSDCIRVPEGMESLLSAWLGSRFQTLLTSSSDIAWKGLSRLSQESQGRASIQLLRSSSTKKSKDSQMIELQIEKAQLKKLGTMKDYLRFEKTEEAELLNTLLTPEKVWLVEGDLQLFLSGLSSLEDLAGITLLTKEGAILSSSGVLSWGKNPENEDLTSKLLARKNQIHALEVELHEKASITQKVEIEVLERTTLLESLESQERKLQTQVRELELEARSKEREIVQLTQSIEQLTREESRLVEERSKLSHQEEELRLREEDLRLGLLEKQDAKIRAESEASQAREILERFETALKFSEEELSQARILLAREKERAQSLQREVDSGTRLLEDRKRRLAEIEKSVERVHHEAGQHSGGDSEFTNRIENLMKEISDLREKLALFRNDLEQVSARVTSGLQEIKKLHSQGDSKTYAVSQYSVETERLLSELQYLTQNLEEKYGVGCLEEPQGLPIQDEMSEPVVTAEMTQEEEKILNEEVEHLREKIRALGDVNPEAEEQFQELKTRHDYLMTEKRDLQRSIENLHEAIEHINKTSEERFRKAFEAIADRFERLFPIIFGGGQAKLSLVYPEGSQDILDAGVDIMAQPPGKKVVNIQLLSGGEKALTAVSLIFAIFMVKPSPFCVLDEVDAPLDDANIGKFNALLKEMSAKSQFIIITHNKKTMELNDTLYGVTMEEPGVSKLLSVEMN